MLQFSQTFSILASVQLTAEGAASGAGPKMDKSEIPEAAVRNPACEQSQSQCFKCPLCPKSFSRIKVLRLHISSHTKEKPYKCEHCDFSTACEHRHQRHIERNHDRSMWETRLKYKCELCTHKFFVPAGLRLHMLTHSEDREYFPCNVSGCDFKASSSRTLQGHHRRVHNDERPFACQVEGCGYRAKWARDLIPHTIRHGKERPFQCSKAFCGYKGKTQSDLNVHIKFKHGDIFHHCSHADCAYKTRNPNQLKIHSIRHHGNQSFKCTHPKCRYRALTERGLATHLASHVTKTAHKCGFPNCTDF